MNNKRIPYRLNFWMILLSAVTILAVPFELGNYQISLAAVDSGTNYYVDGVNGSDSYSGTNPGQAWKTITKAIKTLASGDTVFIRGGQYNSILNGWSFKNSGTASNPITLTNYPGEQVVFRIPVSNHNYYPFHCWSAPTDPADWQTPKAEYIHIIGTDVDPHTLSDGVVSHKGIVIQGEVGEQAAGIDAAGCSYWEVAGIDFVEVAYGIFTKKRDFQTTQYNSASHWYVHDNRVYNYYRESGMQFNSDYNRIENNEIYKISNEIYSPFGCQHINLLGNHNLVRNNTLSRSNSTANCGGILFEWDLSDYNIIEKNRIFDVPWGINFSGGDHNIIRNNLIYSTGSSDSNQDGIEINSYDTRTSWPCNETDAEAVSILPANDPAAPDYPYYYTPRNCHSTDNQIYNNTIHGFNNSIRIYQAAGENTSIRNNIFSGWSLGSVCFYSASTGRCKALPETVIVDHNIDSGNFGFTDLDQFNFHLSSSSNAVDAGYNLISDVVEDFDGNSRPLGANYDLGAYEYIQSGLPPTALPSMTPVPPTTTPTAIAPTSSPVPPTPTLVIPSPTSTQIAPTPTSINPSATPTVVLATSTQIAPSATATVVAPTSTRVVPSPTPTRITPTPTSITQNPSPTPTQRWRHPKISHISPNTVSILNLTSVSILGQDFLVGATIQLGEQSCEQVQYINESEISCLVPPESQGQVDVIVTNPDGQFDILPDGLIYNPPAQISTFFPAILKINP